MEFFWFGLLTFRENRMIVYLLLLK